MTCQDLRVKSDKSKVTSQDLQVRNEKSRMISQDFDLLINRLGYLKPTRLDLQVLARKLLPFATKVRLAIFMTLYDSI